MKNTRRGQVIVEYILLMVILFSLSAAVFKMFGSASLSPFSRFVDAPKALFQGLSRSGAWKTYKESDPADSKDMEHHPANQAHYLQVEGLKTN